ncbi:MAG: tRNA (adenosine(37)-N6)-dimethylallyltransferase MiaA [Victivallaceae bacterium]|nr:tRNA (adenosine(37)-N6)-dimethylallyltransferase MiaA [Victivallaceae bacterium]MDD4180028.1 tRNA (adenosine(37)-N6)-dimethylallyltransferase MiaA [Victivallaceae bacterium]
MKPILIITGATACGKSALALDIARECDGEIISADSMQLYRGLDIGVAKPTAAEQAEIRHHLIDVFDFNKRLDVYTFVELAEAAVHDVWSRHKLPIIVGGTGMYIKAFLYGLDPLPSDPTLRAQLNREFDGTDGFERLKNITCETIPDDFERWQQHHRKLLRAFEVFKLTGSSITKLQTLKQPKLRWPATVWNLVREREELKQRIAHRTEAMLNNGWIEEARVAIANGLLESPTAWQALGYAVIGKYLEGDIDYETMKTQIITTTWQLARRQITWFKGQHPEAEHLPFPCDHQLLIERVKLLYK